jgi:hypothetical protein
MEEEKGSQGERLSQFILSQIEKRGPIPFSQFMLVSTILNTVTIDQKGQKSGMRITIPACVVLLQA